MNTYHRRFLTLEERLRSSIGPPDENGCRPWTGHLTSGYGRISVGYAERKVVRVLWEMEHGPIPSGLHVCHRCDNPACCAVEHLWLGTHADNMADKARKGRAPATRLKLSAEQVREIRNLRDLGLTCKEIGGRFGVTGQYVGNIVRGEVWKCA